MKVHCEAIDLTFEVPERPARIVCLTSGTTEALFAMGLGERVAGVSCYCGRYVEGLDRPVAGNYLNVDESVLEEIRPDLLLLASGLQMRLARHLAGKGWPVYVLPLPSSFHGVLENIITAAALAGVMERGRALCRDLARRAHEIRSSAPAVRPSVYAELWLGRHPRAIGGRTFIADTIEIAGGDPIFSGSAGAYLDLPLEGVAERKPDVVLGFSEPEHPVDFEALLAARGWSSGFAPRLVVSTVERGRNVIHDGPSMIETAEWLSRALRAFEA